MDPNSPETARDLAARDNRAQLPKPVTPQDVRPAPSPGGIGKYLGLALMLPISTGVGYGLGYGLDALFHTTWLRFVFMGFGTVAGFIDLVREADGDK